MIVLSWRIMRYRMRGSKRGAATKQKVQDVVHRFVGHAERASHSFRWLGAKVETFLRSQLIISTKSD